MNEFIATIFNWFNSLYEQDWDNFLYDQGFYSYVGLIFISIAVITAAIYYFTPTASFAGRVKWFIFMAVMSVSIFASCFGVCDYWAVNSTEEELPTYDFMDEIGTSFISVIWGIVTYFLSSLIMMPFSISNKFTPFKA